MTHIIHIPLALAVAGAIGAYQFREQVPLPRPDPRYESKGQMTKKEFEAYRTMYRALGLVLQAIENPGALAIENPGSVLKLVRQIEAARKLARDATPEEI